MSAENLKINKDSSLDLDQAIVQIVDIQRKIFLHFIDDELFEDSNRGMVNLVNLKSEERKEILAKRLRKMKEVINITHPADICRFSLELQLVQLLFVLSVLECKGIKLKVPQQDINTVNEIIYDFAVAGVALESESDIAGISDITASYIQKALSQNEDPLTTDELKLIGDK
jgi:hypothetical protein